LIVRVVISIAGEDLTPPPFFIIFCVHLIVLTSPCWLCAKKLSVVSCVVIELDTIVY
jgi:hypothetical protein